MLSTVNLSIRLKNTRLKALIDKSKVKSKPRVGKLPSSVYLALLGMFWLLFLSGKAWAQDCTPENIKKNIEKIKIAGTETQKNLAKRKVTKCEKEALRPLKAILNPINPDLKLRTTTIEVIGEIGSQEAVLILREALKDQEEDIRSEAILALAGMGKNAKSAAPELRSLLTNESQSIEIRRRAAYSLGEIDSKDNHTVKALIKALEDDEEIRQLAISSLAIIISKYNYQLLVRRINDEQVGLSAAEALGKSGWQVNSAIGRLVGVLETEGNEEERWRAIEAIKSVAQALQDKAENKTLSSENLKQAIVALEKAKATLDSPKVELKDFRTQEIKDIKTQVDQSLKALRKAQSTPLLNWLAKYPFLWGFILYLICLLSVYHILLWRFPLRLLYLHEFLKKHGEISIPFLSFSLPLRYLVLGGLFHDHERVLDAWIEQHIQSAREEFLKTETVKTRKIYVPVPVTLDDDRDSLSPKDLQPLFAKKQTRLLICGEGGSGKTSLACEIAKWAIEDEPTRRLAQHRMLPILIEQDLKLKEDEGHQAFIRAIHGKLQDLSNESEPISQDLLEQLLRKQRLLVIVDRFSEMSKVTQEVICPEQPTFPVFALIVTSRSEKTLNEVDRTIIKPLRLDGSQLLEFMEKYLVQRDKDDLFSSSDLLYACGDLSNLLKEIERQNRSTTVLFAKLYTEVLIAFKEGKTVGSMPTTIPDLMLQYLNELNSSVTEDKLDDRMIHQDVKAIAWQCLKDNYRPTAAHLKDIIAALGGDNAEMRLHYLEKRLCLIKTLEPAKDQISFDLDPLAEYLAGLYLVEHYGSDEKFWIYFLTTAQKMPDSPEAIKGFIFAVRDCCLAHMYNRDNKVLSFVVDKMNQLVNCT